MHESSPSALPAGSAAVERLHADQTLSLSDFKRNPSAALRAAGGRPLAVLNHNRVSFYVVDPTFFGVLLKDHRATPAGLLSQVDPDGAESPENPAS